MRSRFLHIACYALTGVALVGAGAYLVLGPNKGLGIFLAILALIITRVLVINLASGRD